MKKKVHKHNHTHKSERRVMRIRVIILKRFLRALVVCAFLFTIGELYKHDIFKHVMDGAIAAFFDMIFMSGGSE